MLSLPFFFFLFSFSFHRFLFFASEGLRAETSFSGSHICRESVNFSVTLEKKKSRNFRAVIHFFPESGRFCEREIFALRHQTMRVVRKFNWNRKSGDTFRTARVRPPRVSFSRRRRRKKFCAKPQSESSADRVMMAQAIVLASLFWLVRPESDTMGMLKK